MAVIITLIVGIIMGAGVTIIALTVLSEREGENDEQRGEGKSRYRGLEEGVSMISWWWLIVAFACGAMFGLVLFAVVASNRSDDA